MASVNKVILIGNLGRCDDLSTPAELAESVLSRIYAACAERPKGVFNHFVVMCAVSTQMKVSRLTLRTLSPLATLQPVTSRWPGVSRGRYFGSQRPNARNAP
jgi:hypothetical protein